jgi:1,2-diacylglycerol 3-alpha-glucosyltransferase
MKKIAIIYPYIPHYRKAIIDELSASVNFDYVIFADSRKIINSIPNYFLNDNTLFREAKWHNFNCLGFQSGLLKCIFNYEFDCLIFLGNPYYISSWLYALIARLNGKKIVFWTHGWIKKDKIIKKNIRNLFYRISHILFLYGNRARNVGLNYEFKESQLSVIYNSLDYDVQKFVRNSIVNSPNKYIKYLNTIGLKDNGNYLAYVGRLMAASKLDQLILSAKILREKYNIALTIVLIGDGPERNSLEELANDNNINIIFLGETYDEWKIGPILFKARLVISPGKVGLTALHSLAYGTPVLTHSNHEYQMPESEAIISNLTGDFFNMDDIEDIASCIYKWLLIPKDDFERKNCIQTLEENYTPQAQLIAIETALIKLLY